MKNVAKKAAIVAVLATLTGCHNVWVKPGATQTDFDQDLRQCAYEASMGAVSAGASTGRGLYGGIQAGMAEGSKRNELQQLCMEARGYRVEAQR